MPLVPAAGIPLSTAVEESKLTPFGSAPLRLTVGGRKPRVVTANVPAVPTVNVLPAGLVNAGASATATTRSSTVSGAVPLLAVNRSTWKPPVPAAGVPIQTAVCAVRAAGALPVARGFQPSRAG